MAIIKSLQNESGATAARAEIHQNADGLYEVHYYSIGNANAPIVETYAGKSIHYVTDAAENWLDGIKVLNG